MGHRKGLYRKGPDLERPRRLDDHGLRGMRKEPQSRQRTASGMNRNTMTAREAGRAPGVVAMLVSEDNRNELT